MLSLSGSTDLMSRSLVAVHRQMQVPEDASVICDRSTFAASNSVKKPASFVALWDVEGCCRGDTNAVTIL